MPTKIDRLARRKNDPLVPIVAERVSAALSANGKTTLQAGRAAGVSRQAIDSIVDGTTLKCRRSLRAALAKLCGAPITAAFLGGEQDLKVGTLRYPPSGKGAFGKTEELEGPGRPPGGADAMPPRRDLEALGLGQEIVRALELEKQRLGSPESVGEGWPAPDLNNAMRWMLSLTFWREAITRDLSQGRTVPTLAEDADEFAHHLAAAMRILLRTWIDGRKELRPYTIARLCALLDNLYGESFAIFLAQLHNDQATLFILDHQYAYSAAGIRSVLEQRLDEMREAGHSDEEIIERLKRGDE